LTRETHISRKFIPLRHTINFVKHINRRILLHLLHQSFHLGEKVNSVEDLYHQLFPALLLQGRIMGANDHMIRDVIHDIFLDLLEKESLTKGIRNFKAYISISFRRKLAKTLRKQFSDLDESKIQKEDAYESHLIESERNQSLKENLQRALLALTPAQKSIIKLRFFSGLSYEEIAVEQGCTLRTVYNQVYSAIKLLRGNKSLK